MFYTCYNERTLKPKGIIMTVIEVIVASIIALSMIIAQDLIVTFLPDHTAKK